MRVDLNLPWSCEKGAVEIIDADGGTAAYALSSSETPHIVKAVNNHEALVIAARLAAVQLTSGVDNSDGRKYALKKCMEALRSVDSVEI